MISSIEEGLLKYKNLLREYFEMSEAMKQKYGHSDFMTYGGDDHGRLVRTDARLSTMEEVLGLSKEEKKEIQREIKESMKGGEGKT